MLKLNSESFPQHCCVHIVNRNQGPTIFTLATIDMDLAKLTFTERSHYNEQRHPRHIHEFHNQARQAVKQNAILKR